MSTNRKNKYQKTPFLNFTNNRLQRQIYICEQVCQEYDLDIEKINLRLYKEIEKLSFLIHDRNLPYFQLITNSSYDDTSSDRLRLVIKGTTPEKYSPPKYNKDITSHLVEVQLAHSYHIITSANENFHAKIIIECTELSNVIIDVLLDISMFNSFSFLECMDVTSRQIFSKKKVEFLQKNFQQDMNYYECLNIENLEYFSLAFLARTSGCQFDCIKYIETWNVFLESAYPRLTNEIPDLATQLKNHVDCGQLSVNAIQNYIASLDKGAYLILRINKICKTYNPQLEAIFGTATPKVGKIKIVPINRYNEIEKLAERLIVSCFKIIID